MEHDDCGIVSVGGLPAELRRVEALRAKLSAGCDNYATARAVVHDADAHSIIAHLRDRLDDIDALRAELEATKALLGDPLRNIAREGGMQDELRALRAERDRLREAMEYVMRPLAECSQVNETMEPGECGILAKKLEAALAGVEGKHGVD